MPCALDIIFEKKIIKIEPKSPNTPNTLMLKDKYFFAKYSLSFGLSAINLESALGTPAPEKSKSSAYTGNTIWYIPIPSLLRTKVKGTL